MQEAGDLRSISARHKAKVEDDDAGGDEHTMLEDMRRMLRNEAFHDIVFVCGEEEEEIGACRMFVASRSPVLESMLLSSGMSESKLARISLPEIEPSTMHICIEFLYTDAVQEGSWRSILSAMNVVKAAMFFLLKRLERLAIAYMHITSFRDRYEDDEWNTGIIAAYNLGLELYPAHLSNQEKSLLNMSNLLDKFRVYVQNRVGWSTEKLFSGCSRERFFYKHLSEMAFIYTIQTPARTMSQQPLTEYFSFLHLVRWSASRLVLSDPSICEDELEEVLNRCIPRSLDVLSSNIVLDVDEPHISRYIKLLAKQLAMFLPSVRLQFNKIPTDILCRFIEPLQVIPRLTLMRAYRAQALSVTDLRWDPLGHAQKYSIDNNDMTVITCSKKTFEGFARCNTYLSTTNTTFFEWEIAILIPCEKIRIGFYIYRPTDTRILNYDGLALGDEKGSWALGEDGCLYNDNFESGKRSRAYVDSFHGKEGTVVQVHLHMANKQCSFTINGEEAGVAWNQIPFGSHMVYPALSLKKPGKAQVRMIHHSWMEGPSKRPRLSNLENI